MSIPLLGFLNTLEVILLLEFRDEGIVGRKLSFSGKTRRDRRRSTPLLDRRCCHVRIPDLRLDL